MGSSTSFPTKRSRSTRTLCSLSQCDHDIHAKKKHNLGTIARIAEAKTKFINTNSRKEAMQGSKQVNGTNFIKELYHRLDPSIALPNAVDITGEIQVALKYNSDAKLLLIKVIQARELVPRDLTGFSDPYAAVKIVPDRYNEGVKSTRRKLRTVNPIFQEIFSFTSEEAELQETKVCIDLFDYDLVGSDDFLGEAVIDISKMNLSNELTYSEWFMLQHQTNFSVTGDVDVSLFHDADILFVTIHKATDLLDCALKDCSTLVSIHIPFTNQSKMSKIADGCINPQFEETFEFDMCANEVPFRSIIMNIYRISQSEEKPIGSININLKRYKTGQRCRNWYRVTDMKNTGRQRTLLGESIVTQEFREAMLAHSLYRCPSFMFQNDRSGKKVYSVSCLQASSSSKVILVNGFPLR